MPIARQMDMGLVSQMVIDGKIDMLINPNLMSLMSFVFSLSDS